MKLVDFPVHANYAPVSSELRFNVQNPFKTASVIEVVIRINPDSKTAKKLLLWIQNDDDKFSRVDVVNFREFIEKNATATNFGPRNVLLIVQGEIILTSAFPVRADKGNLTRPLDINPKPQVIISEIHAFKNLES